MKLRWYFQHLKGILGLSLQLAKANFKLRNEGSFFGIFWYLLEPFLLFLIILIIRGMINIKSIEHYPLYLLLGLVIFNFFSGTTSKSTNLISRNANFIKSMKINHESLVVSQVIEGCFSHFFEIVLFLVFMVYFKVSLIWILFYIIIFSFLFLFLIGMSFLLSTIGAYVNDLNNVWSIIMRFLFFATPIFYVVQKDSLIYKVSLFNPVYYFLENSRSLIIYNKFPELWLMVVPVIFSLVVFLLGIYIFEKFKYRFAEVI